MNIDDQIETPAPRRSPALPIAIVAVVLAAVSAAVIFFVAAASGSEFDPIKVAELAPADTHFFMAVNTDFASDPWIAVPRLLDSLGIEQTVRDDLDESLAEDNTWDGDVAPALATIRRAGFATQYSSDGGEWVAVIDSRDPQRVIDISFGLDVLDSEEHDDELDLDFKIYLDRSDPTDYPAAVTTHDGIIYIASEPAHISSFIRRLQSGAPLSDSTVFQDAIANVSESALLVGYGSGNVFNERDFRDIVDAFAEDAELDPRDASLAFAVTARDSGFGARMVVSLGSGFGVFQSSVSEPLDLAGISGLTPDDALFFFAGSGLHDGLAESFKNLENDPTTTDMIAPYEELIGLSLTEDLIPFFGNSYGISVGGPGFTSDDLDTEDIWVLGLIESPDPAQLAENLDYMAFQLGDLFCACDLGIGIEDRGGYVHLRWPDAAPANGALRDAPSFLSTLELLPRDMANLLFFNLSALPEDLIRETSADWSNDSDGYEVDLTALSGFALAVYSDDTSMTVDLVLPITGASE